jgi:glycosyltransferase involved in cell wall biosynthesis
MIDRIGRLSELSRALGTDLPGMADRAEAGAMPDPGSLSPEQRVLFEDTDWTRWRFGAHWAELLGSLARKSDRIAAISPHDRDEALRLLGVDEDRIEIIPNGVDTGRFDRRAVSTDERLSRWHRWLVADPQGWDESGEPGSIGYDEGDLHSFTDPETKEASTVLLYVGRFLDFKRVPMLIRAYARARPRFDKPAPLVIWGGSPGEWGEEHPYTVALREGTDDVFFLGWRGHDELPDGLACSDALVVPSLNEPFGLVLLEAMSSGLPVIATRSGGPLTFVNTEPGHPNGWMIEPDKVDELAEALVETVNDPEERRRRGRNAYEQIRSTYSWDVLAERIGGIYGEMLD